MLNCYCLGLNYRQQECLPATLQFMPDSCGFRTLFYVTPACSTHEKDLVYAGTSLDRHTAPVNYTVASMPRVLLKLLMHKRRKTTMLESSSPHPHSINFGPLSTLNRSCMARCGKPNLTLKPSYLRPVPLAWSLVPQVLPTPGASWSLGGV